MNALRPRFGGRSAHKQQPSEAAGQLVEVGPRRRRDDDPALGGQGAFTVGVDVELDTAPVGGPALDLEADLFGQPDVVDPPGDAVDDDLELDGVRPPYAPGDQVGHDPDGQRTNVARPRSPFVAQHAQIVEAGMPGTEEPGHTGLDLGHQEGIGREPVIEEACDLRPVDLGHEIARGSGRAGAPDTADRDHVVGIHDRGDMGGGDPVAGVVGASVNAQVDRIGQHLLETVQPRRRLVGHHRIPPEGQPGGLDRLLGGRRGGGDRPDPPTGAAKQAGHDGRVDDLGTDTKVGKVLPGGQAQRCVGPLGDGGPCRSAHGEPACRKGVTVIDTVYERTLPPQNGGQSAFIYLPLTRPGGGPPGRGPG
jgi:hypothetical protein